MKVSDIIRNVILMKIADELESDEEGCGCGCQGDQEHISAETGVMVPPLQAQIEILKKNAGIENVYDNNPTVDDHMGQTPMG